MSVEFHGKSLNESVERDETQKFSSLCDGGLGFSKPLPILVS